MRKVCIHGIEDPAARQLDGFEIAAQTVTRDDLRTTMGMETIDALILDIDDRDSVDIIIQMLEIRPELVVIGITGSSDVNRVIQAQRAGCQQFASRPIDPSDLTTALRNALDEAPEKITTSKTVAVIGSTGGAGTTTFSCYLAMAFAERSKSAALVDIDFEFGSVAKSWDLNPKYTIHDLCQFDPIDKQAIEDVMVELPSGVSVLPRPARLQQAQEIEESALRTIVGTIQGCFPFVVLDVPRRLDARTGIAIEMCDKLVIVTQQTVAGMLNAGRLTDGLLEFGMSLDQIEFVINRHNNKIHTLSAEQLEKRVNKKPIGMVPNHYKSVGTATDLGEPVSTGNPVRKAIGEIAAKLGGEKTSTNSGWMASLGLRS